ncbi:uncharacterized protein PAN0_008c3549 [Moesziomyces antarcticus]|uniref:Uncharacterized protein n=2 Tax=Pseudozyma antarctica TaxID=84753 RepID=A0A081CF86_PSEA2|nr:uncharacterized protein PAN0_008c3549 [Moesziomyces antarcticus]GAK65332.1 hypothetical protein PAN0_008c3549 [Moesziomyces antarcticus]SPO46337.1 uncharacterized protein PSANT_04023 [Moesziomyces antarcticus]
MMVPVCWHAAAVFLSVVLSLFIVEVASLPAGSPDSSWSAGSNFVPVDEENSISPAHPRNDPSWHHSSPGQHEGLQQPWNHDPSTLHHPPWAGSSPAPGLLHQHDPAWLPTPSGPLDDVDHMILDNLLSDISSAAPPSGQGNNARLLNHLAQAKPGDILRQSGQRGFPPGLRFGMPTANPSFEPPPDSPGQASSSGSPASPQTQHVRRPIPVEPAVNLVKIPETPPHLPPMTTPGSFYSRYAYPYAESDTKLRSVINGHVFDGKLHWVDPNGFSKSLRRPLFKSATKANRLLPYVVDPSTAGPHDGSGEIRMSIHKSHVFPMSRPHPVPTKTFYSLWSYPRMSYWHQPQIKHIGVGYLEPQDVGHVEKHLDLMEKSSEYRNAVLGRIHV